MAATGSPIGKTNLYSLSGRHTEHWVHSNFLSHEGYSSLEGELPQNTRNSLQSSSEGTSKSIDERYLHQQLSYTSLIYQQPLGQSEKRRADCRDGHIQVHFPKLLQPYTTDLPEFIKPLPKHITTDEMILIRDKGALWMPSDLLRSQIVECYTRYIHPYLPFLDVMEFSKCVNAGEAGQISLLLFQAVMFAAVAFVDIVEIEKLNFKTVREARKTFYDRVRLLYDCDVEADRLTIIQALLLMTFWVETPGDAKGGWHWMGIAMSLSITLGLHKELAYSTLTAEQRRFRRRTWWSCFIRDRLMALGMSRPLAIRDDEYDTSMLTVLDFEVTPESNPKEVRDMIRMAENCVLLAELCTHVGPILSLHFSVLPQKNETSVFKDETGQTTALQFARVDRPKDVQLHNIMQLRDNALQEWYLQRQSFYIRGITYETLDTHTAFVDMVFFSVISALHRPMIQLQECHLQISLSQIRVRDAADEVSRINKELYRERIDRYLPITAITLQLPAMITHLMHLQLSSWQGIKSILISLFDCFVVLERLQKIYVGVDVVIPFILKVMKKSEIIPFFDQESRLNGFLYKGNPYQLRGACSDETASDYQNAPDAYPSFDSMPSLLDGHDYTTTQCAYIQLADVAGNFSFQGDVVTEDLDSDNLFSLINFDVLGCGDSRWMGA